MRTAPTAVLPSPGRILLVLATFGLPALTCLAQGPEAPATTPAHPSPEDLKKSPSYPVLLVPDSNTAILKMDDKPTTVRLQGLKADDKNGAQVLKHLLKGESVHLQYAANGEKDANGHPFVNLFRTSDGAAIDQDLVTKNASLAATDKSDEEASEDTGTRTRRHRNYSNSALFGNGMTNGINPYGATGPYSSYPPRRRRPYGYGYWPYGYGLGFGGFGYRGRGHYSIPHGRGSSHGATGKAGAGLNAAQAGNVPATQVATGPGYSLGAGTFSNPSMGAGTFSNPSLGAGAFSNPSMGAGGFNNRSLGAGAFSNPSMGAGHSTNPSMRTGGMTKGSQMHQQMVNQQMMKMQQQMMKMQQQMLRQQSSMHRGGSQNPSMGHASMGHAGGHTGGHH